MASFIANNKVMHIALSKAQTIQIFAFSESQKVIKSLMLLKLL